MMCAACASVLFLQAQLSYPASKLDMLAAAQLLLDALVPSPFLKQQALALEGLALATDALGPELPPLLRQAGATELQISHVLQHTAQLQRPQLQADGTVQHNNAVELAAAAASDPNAAGGTSGIKSFSTGGLLGSGGSAAFARSRSGRSVGGVEPSDLSLCKFAALQLAGRSQQQSSCELPRAAPAAGAATPAGGPLGGGSAAGSDSLNSSLGGRGSIGGLAAPHSLGEMAAGASASCGGALDSARSTGQESPASPASRLIWTVPPAGGDKPRSSLNNVQQQQQQQLEQLLPPGSLNALSAHAQLIHAHRGSMSAGGVPPQQQGLPAAVCRSSSVPGRWVMHFMPVQSRLTHNCSTPQDFCPCNRCLTLIPFAVT